MIISRIKYPVIEWFSFNDTDLWWLGFSVVTFLATLLAVPVWLVWMPSDYFLKARRDRPVLIKRHPAIRLMLVAGRNMLGYVLILVGVAMLVLPGQGLLTIFAGMLLANFPGKDYIVTWLISRGRVHHSIDWFRRKAGRPPLIVHEEE